MPQVDLETLVTACAIGGSDRKIACETTLADDDPPENTSIAGDDLPPGSFWFSKNAEYDWFGHHSYCYEREDSTKGNSSSVNSKNPHVINPSSNSNSQRFSVNVKSKVPIIGLPHVQKATFVDPKRRTCNKPANIRLFPAKRSGSSGKSAVQMNEPGSPKVSCMGRVRSKRYRRRSSSVKRSSGDEKPVIKVKKSGFYSKVLDIFRSKKGRSKKTSRSGSRKVAEATAEKRAEPTVRRSVSTRAAGILEPEPPGLGGIKRFSSGRQSWSVLTGEEVN